VKIFIRDLAILIALLLFELWNVCTARKRGRVFVSLWSYEKKRHPRDFHVALFLNVGWVLVIVIVMFMRIREFLME